MNQELLINDLLFRIDTNPALLDISFIHAYLAKESYWAKNIPRSVVEKAVANSFCFGVYQQGKQIGFARLVTDKATFAYLADVFIDSSFRGMGLSKWLMTFIHAHPDVQGLRRWVLGTKDAHGLYAQFGWTMLDEEACSRFMQLHNKQVYH